MVGKLTSYIVITAVCLVSSAVFCARLFLPHAGIVSTFEAANNPVWYTDFPARMLYSEALRRNTLPFWTDLIGGGYPLFAEGSLGTLNLLNLILFRCLPVIWAMNVSYVLWFTLGMLGMWFFQRLQGIRNIPALTGAGAYAFSGLLVTHMTHPSSFSALAMLPVVLAGFQAASRSGGLWRFLAAALLLSQQLFLGDFGLSLITILILCIVTSCQPFRRPAVAAAAAAVVLALVLSAAQILPYAELYGVSQNRLSFTKKSAFFINYPPAMLLTFFSPFLFGSPQNGTFANGGNPGNLFWENSGYIGLLPLFLALFGMVFRFRWRDHKAYYVLLAFFGLVMLGRNSPFYLILTVPPFSLFSNSSAYLTGFVFAVSVFSAVGMEKAGTAIAVVRKRPVMAGLFLISLTDVFLAWYGYHTVINVGTYLKEPPSLRFLDHDARIFSFKADERNFREYGLHGAGDTGLFVASRNELSPNYQAVWKKSSPLMRASLFPIRQAYVQTLLTDQFDAATDSARLIPEEVYLLKAKGVSGIVSSIPLKNPEFSTRMPAGNTEPGAVNIYGNPSARPKYFLSSDYYPYATYEEFLTMAARESTLSGLLVENDRLPPAVHASVRSGITVDEDAETRKRLTVRTEKPAVLAAAVSYYPGWQAAVDGRTVPIFPADLSDLAVWIPEGTHRLSLEYRPGSIRYGFLISLLAHGILILAVIAQLVRNRFRDRMF